MIQIKCDRCGQILDGRAHVRMTFAGRTQDEKLDPAVGPQQFDLCERCWHDAMVFLEAPPGAKDDGEVGLSRKELRQTVLDAVGEGFTNAEFNLPRRLTRADVEAAVKAALPEPLTKADIADGVRIADRTDEVLRAADDLKSRLDAIETQLRDLQSRQVAEKPSEPERTPSETSMDAIKEASRKASSGAPVDALKEASRDAAKDTTTDAPKKPAAKDTAMDTPKKPLKSAIDTTPTLSKAPVKASKAQPVDCGRIMALKDAGWTYEAIADDMRMDEKDVRLAVIGEKLRMRQKGGKV